MSFPSFLRGGVVLAALTTCAIGASPAEKIPIADFARAPELLGAKLSPDGKVMGYIFYHHGVPQLAFLDLATGKAIRGARNADWLVATDFSWVGPQRALTYSYNSGLAAVDADGRNLQHFVRLTHKDRTVSEIVPLAAGGDDPHHVLIEVFPHKDWKRVLRPDVFSIDTLEDTMREVVKNPGDVRQWLSDWSGQVRYGLKLDGTTTKLLHRATSADTWQEVSGLAGNGDDLALVGADESGEGIYFSRPDESGRWALFHYDPKNPAAGEPVFRHADYDILPDAHELHYAGFPLNGAMFSPRHHSLIGVTYVADVPRQYWIDPVLAALQRQLDTLYPDTVNLIVNASQQGDRLLVLSWSDRDPGFYSLVDLGRQKIVVLGHLMPGIDPQKMAKTYPIECKARDGLPLHGYLTVPVGAPQTNLPMVVLVHGGPWVRDVWGYDSVVQFLASRGYAVLQTNYRGSTGYGQDFLERGKKEIGGAIQDDIADSVRWAIRKGLADPKRIAIMGASYGGYSVAFALAKTPELYRCGIDVSGVSDWLGLFEHVEDQSEDATLSKALWAEMIGDLGDEAERRRLAAVSPVNFAADIKAPLLIVHGKWDDNVPLSQAKALVAALKRAGHPLETLFITYLGHSWPTDDSGEDFYRTVEKFLARNLAAAAP